MIRTFSYMSSGTLNGGIAINIWQLTQTKAIRFVIGIRESVYDDGVRLGMKYFAHSWIQFIVSDATPIDWLLVRYRS